MNLTEMKALISQIYDEHLHCDGGNTASYIPELAKVDPNLFGISVTSVTGETVSAGQTESLFTLQSTSKPIVYGLALAMRGEAYVHSKVGVEPTGEAFNSIIELEEKSHRPFNPMINSGAIATTSLILGKTFSEKLKNILNQFESLVGHPLNIDENVYESEKNTAHRNWAIAHLMKHFGVMDGDIEETLYLYFKQCSINMNCNDLSMLAATYANHGIHPLNKVKVMNPDIVVKTLCLMFTCGMYDTAGEWAFKVGLPAKSGVSGAMFTVLPGKFGLAVYSPRIDEHGHSVRGRLVIESIAKRMGANVFGSGVLT